MDSIVSISSVSSSSSKSWSSSSSCSFSQLFSDHVPSFFTCFDPGSSNGLRAYLDKNSLEVQPCSYLIAEHKIFLHALLSLLDEQERIGIPSNPNHPHTLKTGPLKKVQVSLLGGGKMKFVEIRKGLFSYYDDMIEKGKLSRNDVSLRASCTRVREVKNHGNGWVFELIAERGKTSWMCHCQKDRNEWMDAIHEGMIGFRSHSISSQIISMSQDRTQTALISPYKEAADQYFRIKSQIDDAKRNQEEEGGEEDYQEAFKTLINCTHISLPLYWIKGQCSRMSSSTNNATFNIHNHTHSQHSTSSMSIYHKLKSYTVSTNNHLLSGSSKHGPERIMGVLTRCLLEYDQNSNAGTNETNLTEVQATSNARTILLTYPQTCSQFGNGKIEDFLVRDLLNHDKVIINPSSTQPPPIKINVTQATGHPQNCNSSKHELACWIFTRIRSNKPWREYYALLSSTALTFYRYATPRPHGLHNQFVLSNATMTHFQVDDTAETYQGTIFLHGEEGKERQLQFESKETFRIWHNVLSKCIADCSTEVNSNKAKLEDDILDSAASSNHTGRPFMMKDMWKNTRQRARMADVSETTTTNEEKKQQTQDHHTISPNPSMDQKKNDLLSPLILSMPQTSVTEKQRHSDSHVLIDNVIPAVPSMITPSPSEPINLKSDCQDVNTDNLLRNSDIISDASNSAIPEPVPKPKANAQQTAKSSTDKQVNNVTQSVNETLSPQSMRKTRNPQQFMRATSERFLNLRTHNRHKAPPPDVLNSNFPHNRNKTPQELHSKDDVDNSVKKQPFGGPCNTVIATRASRSIKHMSGKVIGEVFRGFHRTSLCITNEKEVLPNLDLNKVSRQQQQQQQQQQQEEKIPNEKQKEKVNVEADTKQSIVQLPLAEGKQYDFSESVVKETLEVENEEYVPARLQTESDIIEPSNTGTSSAVDNDKTCIPTPTSRKAYMRFRQKKDEGSHTISNHFISRKLNASGEKLIKVKDNIFRKNKINARNSDEHDTDNHHRSATTSTAEHSTKQADIHIPIVSDANETITLPSNQNSRKTHVPSGKGIIRVTGDMIQKIPIRGRSLFANKNSNKKNKLRSKSWDRVKDIIELEIGPSDGDDDEDDDEDEDQEVFAHSYDEQCYKSNNTNDDTTPLAQKSEFHPRGRTNSADRSFFAIAESQESPSAAEALIDPKTSIPTSHSTETVLKNKLAKSKSADQCIFLPTTAPPTESFVENRKSSIISSSSTSSKKTTKIPFTTRQRGRRSAERRSIQMNKKKHKRRSHSVDDLTRQRSKLSRRHTFKNWEPSYPTLNLKIPQPPKMTRPSQRKRTNRYRHHHGETRTTRKKKPKGDSLRTRPTPTVCVSLEVENEYVIDQTSIALPHVKTTFSQQFYISGGQDGEMQTGDAIVTISFIDNTKDSPPVTNHCQDSHNTSEHVTPDTEDPPVKTDDIEIQYKDKNNQ